MVASPFRLDVSDLNDVIHAITEGMPRGHPPDSILTSIGLAGKAPGPGGHDVTAWQSAVETALTYEDDYLRMFIDEARERMPTRGKRGLAAALDGLALVCIKRVLRKEHPELDPQVRRLLSANSPKEMRSEANAVRRLALSIHAMLSDPLLGPYVVEPDLGVVDPERRRLDLADLAVNVVGATDYLLVLLPSGGEAESVGFSIERDLSRQISRSGQEREDYERRMGRVYDARGAVVRLGGRLVAGLRHETA